jgi:hypothetical protein
MPTLTTISDLVLNTWTLGSTLGTSVAGSATASIPYWGGGYRTLLCFYSATSTATVTATVSAGNDPPALKAQQLALAPATIAATTFSYLVIDPSRFVGTTGNVDIQFAATADTQTVRVQALRLPRGA